MMGWNYDGGWGGWLMMLFTMLPFWALLGLGGFALFRSLGTDRSHTGEPRLSARQILEERFARGEIDTEEYEQRRAVLGPRG